MGIIEEIEQEIEANGHRIYRFWFSAKQKEAIGRTDQGKGNRYHAKTVTIGGKEHEYTECMSAEHLEQKCNWDDAVYLGETAWRNVK